MAVRARAPKFQLQAAVAGAVAVAVPKETLVFPGGLLLCLIRSYMLSPPACLSAFLPGCCSRRRFENNTMLAGTERRTYTPRRKRRRCTNFKTTQRLASPRLSSRRLLSRGGVDDTQSVSQSPHWVCSRKKPPAGRCLYCCMGVVFFFVFLTNST